MKLAASNIAWEQTDERELLPALKREGVEGIEVAPTKIWPDWQGITPASAAELRARYEGEGFRIPSLQAILFGKPDLLLFGTPAQRSALRDHLLFCGDLAASLGASRLVFGAPKNRLRGGLGTEQAMEVAESFFEALGPEYVARGAVLCLEANPPDYGADFLTASDEARRMVERVHSPGIGLHLDVACMVLAHEDMAAAIRQGAPHLRHFHATEPSLGPFAKPSKNHARAAAALAKVGYTGWVCLEMRATGDAQRDVMEAVRFVRSTYLVALGAHTA